MAEQQQRRKKSSRTKEKEIEWQERVVQIRRVTKVVKADGKKHIIEVPLTKSNSIPHPVNGFGGGAKVMMRPAAPGTGVIAGGAVRTVLELAGVQNILAKQLGSNNPLNNARAAVNALDALRTLADVAQEREVPIENLYV